MTTLRPAGRTLGRWEDNQVPLTADPTVTTTRAQFRALAAEHQFVPVTRTTFVIFFYRKVMYGIASEASMNTHADKALEVLRARQGA